MRQQKEPTLWSWWPLLLGVAVTPLARRTAAVLAMEGPGSLQTLYPYVALVNLHLLRLPEQLASELSQAVMYLQFPVYGLLMSVALRSYGFIRSAVWTALVHFIPLLVLVGLSHF